MKKLVALFFVLFAAPLFAGTKDLSASNGTALRVLPDGESWSVIVSASEAVTLEALEGNTFSLRSVSGQAFEFDWKANVVAASVSSSRRRVVGKTTVTVFPDCNANGVADSLTPVEVVAKGYIDLVYETQDENGLVTTTLIRLVVTADGKVFVPVASARRNAKGEVALDSQPVNCKFQ